MESSLIGRCVHGYITSGVNKANLKGSTRQKRENFWSSGMCMWKVASTRNHFEPHYRQPLCSVKSFNTINYISSKSMYVIQRKYITNIVHLHANNVWIWMTWIYWIYYWTAGKFWGLVAARIPPVSLLTSPFLKMLRRVKVLNPVAKSLTGSGSAE